MSSTEPNAAPARAADAAADAEPLGPGGGPADPPPHTAGKTAGVLQELPRDDILAKRDQVMMEQAARGQEPGLSMLKDKQGANVQNEWGMTETLMDPDKQT